MRLTLRTMLAYLDDILEPADRDDIGHKIEESQFAIQLVQRIRDCTRKARLSAPQLSGKGTDPNSVAEYLDNTLAGERVPDFEKVCLESDVYLAEVASCHQILTMVLGQPAQIDPHMKSRMYEIGNHGAPQLADHANSTAADEHSGAMPDELWVKPARSRPQVPDYLRQTGAPWKWKSMVAAIALLVILAGAITMALGPWETNPIAGLLGLRQGHEKQVAENGGKLQADSQGNDSKPLATANGNSDAAPSTANGADSTNLNVASKSGDEGNNAPAPEAPLPGPASNPPPGATHPGVLATPQAPAASTIVPSAPNSTTTSHAGGSEHAASDQNLLPPEVPVPAREVPMPAPTGTANAARTRLPSDVPAPADSTLALPAASADILEPIPATSEVPLGRFLPGKGIVLLRYDTANQQWNKVPASASLNSGDQLLVLPTYRPTLTLSAGLTLQVSPETMLQLQPPDAQGIPGIKIMFGRFVALTTGKAGTRIRLTAGNSSGVVVFSDVDATLGLEVRRYLPAGANPEAQDSHVVADLYAANGHFEWTPSNGAPITLNAPQRWTLSGNPADAPAAAAVPISGIPKWINNPEPLNPNDVRASEALATALDGDKPLVQALREMVEHQRVEYCAMGAQCLALLDEFEPLIAAFHDENQRPMWNIEIACVRAAVARGPATAAHVREACVKRLGDEAGKDFYRLFWGYTKDQLQKDQAAKLVEYLDNENLEFRVVAFADLQDITNKTFYYRPDAPASTRRGVPLRRWQDELRNGLIVPREIPARP